MVTCRVRREFSHRCKTMRNWCEFFFASLRNKVFVSYRFASMRNRKNRCETCCKTARCEAKLDAKQSKTMRNRSKNSKKMQNSNEIVCETAQNDAKITLCHKATTTLKDANNYFNMNQLFTVQARKMGRGRVQGQGTETRAVTTGRGNGSDRAQGQG